MRDGMQYKGYYGSVHYNDHDKVFFGKIEFIQSLVTYEGTDVSSLNAAFKEAVDDYLEVCEKKHKTPEVSFKGSFNVRVGSELHRRATLYAKDHETSLNHLVTKGLEKIITQDQANS